MLLNMSNLMVYKLIPNRVLNRYGMLFVQSVLYICIFNFIRAYMRVMVCCIPIDMYSLVRSLDCMHIIEIVGEALLI
jgi:hypothetical protein